MSTDVVFSNFIKSIGYGDNELIKLIPVNYAIAPSSSSGRYHSAGETLCEHTIKVTKVCITICKYFRLDGLEVEKILLSAILHDIAKYSDNKYDDNMLIYKSGGHTRNDHAERAYKILLPYHHGIAKIIRVHMQKWSTIKEVDIIWNDLINNRCTDRDYELGLIVAYADYKSSKAELNEQDILHLKSMFNAMKFYFEVNKNER